MKSEHLGHRNCITVKVTEINVSVKGQALLNFLVSQNPLAEEGNKRLNSL